jgi:hypothetical protein
MFQQIFLDMDGVIVDFDQGVRDEYNAQWWYPTEWKIPYKQLGTDFESFWQNMDSSWFWETLCWTEDGKRIVALLEPFKPCILSASLMPQATAGKLLWLKSNYPATVKDGRAIIVSGHAGKAAIAGPGKILIDDKNENIDEWEAAGGIGILYPRPWNRFANAKYPLEYLCSALMTALDNR